MATTQNEHIAYLWQQLLETKATGPELDELIAYVQSHPDDTTSRQILEQQLTQFRPEIKASPDMWQERLEQILRQDAAPGRTYFLKTAWLRYAAILLLIAGTAWWLSHPGRKTPEDALTGITRPGSLASPNTDLPPGTTKATLTLADGSTLPLDSTANPMLAEKGISNHNAQISYTNAHAIATTNILTTPRGGQYKLQLSDGTMVWLNAASSITYPTAFTESNRTVTISGEAYFEVTTDKARPFIVKTPTDEINVLGTSFNINAYPNEPAVKTTLVDGSVKIGKVLLKPGEAHLAGKLIQTDINQDIAWKNGFFNFNHTTLREAARQLERWYDIEVIIPPDMRTIYFGGRMSRDNTLTDVLSALKGFGISYSLEGRRLLLKS